MRGAGPFPRHDAAVGVCRVRRAKRGETRQRLVHQNAEGPPVASFAVAPVEEDLRGDVVGGAAEGVGAAAAREDLLFFFCEERVFLPGVEVVRAGTDFSTSFFLSLSFALSPVLPWRIPCP